MEDVLRKLTLPPYLVACLEAAPSITIADSRAQLWELALGTEGADVFDIAYDVPGQGLVKEADVVRCRNGISVNYAEDYIRRRDPDCMRIGDELPSDKRRFKDDYGPFAPVKAQTLDWLATQDLIVVPFKAGGPRLGSPSIAVIPKNCGFFATALVDLQGFVTFDELDRSKLAAVTNKLEIAGGNHAYFGNYGEQAGDGTASISRENQQAQAVTAILALIGSASPAR